ncbi:MAG: ABC transporter ATP-binding protein [Sedimentisphaerales bacterium]|nr:ABC transporter ATP-binding protein [Sedimentisphaerales bacterium]
MIDNDKKQTAVVECKQLTKIYKKLLAGRSKAVCALQNISLSVGKGQIVGLIGPNGAGKSTLLNLIAGLIFPTEGCVSVCGHPARSIEAHSGLGYMPEHPTFLGRYSARAVLKYHGALSGMSSRNIHGQIDKWTEQLEMTEYIDRQCSDFSQGMKQRLALAVALINDPQMLLLDEPSNGLDPVGIVQLRNFLKTLSEEGTAIVISSHRLGELEKLTSDYLFLYRGQIVSFGEKIASSRVGQLRVELVSNGHRIAGQLLPASKIISTSETELLIAVEYEEEVPDIVCNLVKGGARIKSVSLQKEDIEDVFLRLYQERN